MNRSLMLCVLALVFGHLLVSCGGGDGGGGSASLVSIAVTPAGPSIAKDTTRQFTATGTYSDSTTQDLTASATWSSSDTAVATVSSAGLATAVAAGTTTITAASGGISGNTTLTVTAATLASIAVTPAGPSIAKGTTQQFTATGTFSDSTTQNLTTQVTWSSSDTGKATINSAGLATSVAAGSTTITAASGSISGNTTLTVTEATAATLASIAVTPANPSIVRSAVQQFTATGAYTDSTTNVITSSVTWGSTSTSVATISAGGMVTPLSAGTTTITAVSGSISGNTTLTVQGVNLPKTGQIASYPTATSPDDGFYKRGVAWPEPRITVTYCDAAGPCADQTSDCDSNAATDVVTDNLTGLMWARNGNLAGGTMVWANALIFADGLTRCGHTDWRLPNRKELRSLANYGQGNVATWLNSQGFSNVQAHYYWSSTTHAGYPTVAWYVDMVSGGVLSAVDKTSSVNVWPVRSAYTAQAATPKTGQITSYGTGTIDDGGLQRGVAWPGTRFTTNADTTVADNLTGLVWAPNGNLMPTRDSGWDQDGVANNGAVTWQHALDYVAKLNAESYLGRTDWRLPNVNELESLVHAEYTKETTCNGSCATNDAWLNSQGFSNVQAHYYWSSTTDVGTPSYAWLVYMYGDVSSLDKSNNIYYVWPVRGGQ